MYAEVAWVLVSLGTQVQPQIILNPDYLPDYLSISYDYGTIKSQVYKNMKIFFKKELITTRNLILIKIYSSNGIRCSFFLLQFYFILHKILFSL